MKPRSEANRHALHTAVHASPKSRSLATVINNLDDWEKVVEEFELCGGVITDSDRRTVLLKRFPSTVHSSLVSSLRRCPTYRDTKEQLDSEITFLKDYGPDFKTGSAHLATEQAAAHQAFAAEAEEDEDEEGVIVLDLSGVSEEKAEVLVMAARSSGLRVKPPFRMAGWPAESLLPGPSPARGHAHERRPRLARSATKIAAARTQLRKTPNLNFPLRSRRASSVACAAIGPRTVSSRTSASSPTAEL